MYDYVKPSNDAVDKRILLARLIQQIGKSGSWSGETHIQKSMYFMQALLNVDTSYRFVLYLHGPFSFDVHEVLTWMLSRGEIGVHKYELYGPKLKLTQHGDRLANEHVGLDDQIQWVSEEIATKKVKDLERLATACLLKLELPSWSDSQVADELNRLKPHISKKVALQGIEEFEALREAAASAGVILPSTGS